jgi:hypothetical protein
MRRAQQVDVRSVRGWRSDGISRRRRAGVMLAGIFWKAGVQTKDALQKSVRAALPLKGRWHRIRGWDTFVKNLLRSYHLAPTDNTANWHTTSLAME